VGFGKVELNAAGFAHPLTRGLQPALRVMQWHHAEVTRAPDGAEVLASSASTPVQIMAVGEDILATQFHSELKPTLIERWAHIPQYLEWLDAAMGPNAYERVLAESHLLMPKVEQMGRIMFENLITNRKAIRAAA
jgi:GMP synthase-like glutamine amidotransferase